MTEHDIDENEQENEIDVAVEDERWEGVAPDLDGFVARAVEAALAIVPPDGPIEISIVLTDDPAVQELNRTWRGKDKPTNVLSFPNEQPHGGGPRLLGDVVLAYDTMLRESGEQSKPLDHHLAHLVVHGTLHLLGHDHELGDAEADAMEALEVAALRRLGVPDPYGDVAG
ncbi:rRNA maturation RNase YbeY [Methylobacterium aquaticum]|uniref:rRNA maturation RNase YbeY n=1 Tax=Methylobacterium aquaticum TaxID=270351 RepID=UPI001FEF337E|nr:rRNA maturation RNase YbeY [Methylobacterium aquaticum]